MEILIAVRVNDGCCYSHLIAVFHGIDIVSVPHIHDVVFPSLDLDILVKCIVFLGKSLSPCLNICKRKLI